MAGSFVTARIDIRVPIKDARDVEEIADACVAIANLTQTMLVDLLRDRPDGEVWASKPRIRSPRRSPTVSKESLHTETAQPVQTLSTVSESAGAGPACETCNDKGYAVEMVTAPFAGPDKPPYAKPMTVFCKCPAGEKAAKEMIPQIAATTDDGLDTPESLRRPAP